MAMYFHRRRILSLRKPLISYLNPSPSISRYFSPPIQLQSSPFSSTSLLLKFLSSFNSSPLIHNRTFRRNFHGVRTFATRLSESSTRSNGPPKETIMLEGCDFEHWLVVVQHPDPQLTRDDIIDGYVKTLARVLGSEEEARMKIYSVSTRHYFAFGAMVSEELSIKLKELPNVQWVLPDSYMDVKNKTYAGEPFINGQPVPYDPKYHETWVRNYAESQKNKNRSSRRQRDPNLRSRPHTSAYVRDNSNESWTSAPGPHKQSPQASNMQNQACPPSSLSDPGNHQQNRIPPADYLNEAAQSSPKQIPSHLQNQVQNQSPPTFFHNQAHPSCTQKQATPTVTQNQAPTYTQNQAPPYTQNQAPPYTQNQAPPTYSQYQAPSTYTHNQAPPTYTQNQAPPTYTQNQAPPTYSQNQAPPTYFQNQAPPTYTQNQTPPTYTQNQTPPTYTQNQAPPTFNQNQAPPTYSQAPTYFQNQTPPTSTQNQAPPTFTQNQAPPTYYQNQDPSNYSHNQAPKHLLQTPHMLNQTPPPSSASNPYDPAKNVQSQCMGSATRYQSHPSQPPIPNNNFLLNSMPPSAPASDIPYQVQSWSPASEYQNRSSQPQISHNYSDNVLPSAPARDMPSHMQNTNFHGGSMSSHAHHNDYLYRDIPHHAPSGESSNCYPLESLQQQQYQENHRTYRDAQSSTSMVTHSAQNFPNENLVPPASSRDMHSHMQNPNSPSWNVSPEVQQNGFSRNIPHRVQNDGARPGNPPHTFRNQRYENSSVDLQSSSATASPQNWNYQSNPSMQNVFPNMPMSHGVHGHEYQNKDMPRAIQISEFQHNMGPAAQNVNYNGGANMPNDTNNATVQTRDYQERDSPTDDYICASK